MIDLSNPRDASRQSIHAGWRKASLVRGIASNIARKVACVNSAQPFHSQEWSSSNSSCSLTRNITSHSMKNLVFHSLLRWKMIMLPILINSFIHFSSKGWENVLLSLGVKGLKSHVYYSLPTASRKRFPKPTPSILVRLPVKGHSELTKGRGGRYPTRVPASPLTSFLSLGRLLSWGSVHCPLADWVASIFQVEVVPAPLLVHVLVARIKLCWVTTNGGNGEGICRWW